MRPAVATTTRTAASAASGAPMITAVPWIRRCCPTDYRGTSTGKNRGGGAERIDPRRRTTARARVLNQDEDGHRRQMVST
jgi:hypothetical protein